jgi:TonB family protein
MFENWCCITYLQNIKLLTMKANNTRYFVGVIAAASLIAFSCNNSSDYKNYNDSDAKQNAAIEQSSVDTNAMNIGATAATSPAVMSADTNTASAETVVAEKPAQKAHTISRTATARIGEKKHKGIVRVAVHNDGYATRIKADKKEYAGNTAYHYGPAFPGGEQQLAQYIQNKLEYPQDAIDNDVEGTINVHFAVDEKGNIYQPVIKGEKLGYGLDDEALTVVKNMPKWVPGNLKGKNVKTYYDLPITFTLL